MGRSQGALRCHAVDTMVVVAAGWAAGDMPTLHQTQRELRGKAPPMTKRERELFKALKRLRDALWDADMEDSVTPKVNRAYIAAGDLIAKITTEQLMRRSPGSGKSAL